MNRMRRLVTAVAVAASMALVLPGSATAQAAPQVNQEYDFQLPSVPGLFAPGRQCGGGLFGLSLAPGHASTDSTGNITFSQTFDYAGDAAGPNLGSVTVGWLNLSSFQSGIMSFPINDLPPLLSRAVARSPFPLVPVRLSRSCSLTSPSPGNTAVGRPASDSSRPSVG